MAAYRTITAGAADGRRRAIRVRTSARAPQKLRAMRRRTAHTASAGGVKVPRGVIPYLEKKHGEIGAYRIFMAIVEKELTGGARRVSRLSLAQRATFERIMKTEYHTQGNATNKV